MTTTYSSPTTPYSSSTTTYSGGTGFTPLANAYTIEVAFTVPLLTAPTDPDWTDVTAYLRTFSTRRGRSHELGRTQAGEASPVLDNRDRRFDPLNTSGPYYPNVIPMRHIRIRANLSGIPYDLFRGFVEDWGQQWSGPAAPGLGDATCELHAVDAFKVFNLTDLTSYPSEVLADSPAYYYPLDGFEVSLLTNQGDQDNANLEADTYDHSTSFPSYGASAPLLGGTKAMTVGDYSNGFVTLPGLDYDARKRFLNDWTVEAWAQRPTGTGSTEFFRIGSSFNILLSARVDGSAGLTPYSYKAQVGNLYTVSTTATIPASGWHHIVVVRQRNTATFYVDGVLTETLTGLPATVDDDISSAVTQLELGSYRGGGLAHVAVYDHALDPTRIAAHYATPIGTIEAGQTVDTAITTVLDAMGWPASLRLIDPSGHNVSRHLPDPNALTELLKLAEETDGGVLFMQGDGKVRFVSADSLHTAPTSAAWGDQGSELRYSDLTLRYDDADLYTEVRASADGLDDALAADPAAAVTYGPRSLETSAGYLGTQNQLQDRATGFLTRYKAPALRPETLTAVESTSQPTRTAEMFAADIGRRATVTRRPPGGGAVTVLAAYEGVSYSPVDALLQMRATLNLSPVLDATPWVLGDATNGVLGSTTDLGW